MIQKTDIIIVTGKTAIKQEFRKPLEVVETENNVTDTVIDIEADGALDNSFYDERFDDMEIQLPSVFVGPEDEEEFNETSRKYLSYNDSYSYPLEIDLERLVNNLIVFKQRIPYRQINPHPYSFIQPPPKCHFPHHNNSTKTVLVLIKSAVSNMELRAAVRAMWRDLRDPYVRRVFMLGYNGSYQALVDEEVRQYNDIVQENFLDAYMNNTLKTVMSYNWAMKNCWEADMLLFLDDDYHVQPHALIKYIRGIEKMNKTGVYLGSTAIAAKPERNENSKWKTSFHEYPYDHFPPYIGGGAYLLSKDVARKFKVAFPYVKYLGIDDVYLGIVAKKLAITPKYDAHFSTLSNISLAKECSHDPAELVSGNCQIADRKRRLLLKPTIPLPDGKFLTDNSTFNYPLMVNMTQLVNDKLLRHKDSSIPPINPHPYNYVHRPNRCSFLHADKHVKNVLLLVKSQASNVEERLYLRKLWGIHRDYNFKKVFLLGMGRSKQSLVDEESRKYRDVIQEDFRDDYMNSTRKTIMGFNWAAKFCAQADFIVVLKEGYDIDINRTLKYLRTVLPSKQSSDIFRGKLVKNAYPTRDLDSRLFLSRKTYPLEKFPPFLNEKFYVISSDVAWKFQVAFPFVKYFGRSDVYLGFVARKLQVKPKEDSIFVDPPKLEAVAECPDSSVAKIITKECISSKDLLKTKTTPKKITVIRKVKIKSKLPVVDVT
ncbi:Beta-1,3-galactosyltransferase brn [Mizuhopecten yessoensis]|uniref:Beta-1,3-galactosyltransferase brn n=2 Tax=Mizuhopecten yessoensis TaxID=6573 RepID=A0A210QK15_MIZYE|nr:Beta-1,3-galactosyltransferase brn [Mizuhopecten yessoensis]